MGCAGCGHTYQPAGKPPQIVNIPYNANVVGGFRIPAPIAPIESTYKPVPPPPEPPKNG